MSKIIAVDCDDVLADSYQATLDFHGGKRNGKPLRREQISTFYWRDIPGYGGTESMEELCFSSFFMDPVAPHLIPLIAGSKEGIANLKSYGYTLKVLTGRREIISDLTITWIERNFPGVFDDIVFANHGIYYNTGQSKADLMKKIGAEMLIDDGLHNCKLLADAQIPSLLVDAPWNQNPIDSPYIQRVKSWDEIVAFFAGK